MKFDRLLEVVGREPVFHSSILMAGEVNPADLGRQLSRWVKSGKLIQLRRSLYTLPEQFRKTSPHPFLIANRLKHASYVSLQSALEYHGLIPEYVPSVTSVTTGRPETLFTPLGNFIFKHVKMVLFSDYRMADMGDGQSAYIAEPEKALTDLLYLTPHSDSPGYIKELRLQNIDTLNTELLFELAEKTGKRKLVRAVNGMLTLTKNLDDS